MDELEQRLDFLIKRLSESYDGVGHNTGRPYVYFVYPPQRERALRRIVSESMLDVNNLHFQYIDLLPLTIASLEGHEERRQELLNDPQRGSGAALSIMRLWARTLTREIESMLEEERSSGRPVVVLQGLAALHPLGNPTSLMELIAEKEPRDPATGRIVPVVLFVPGTRRPGASRTYYFLGLEDQRLEFYRGEEV
ncbi:MAG: hypothetical protein GY759_10880 [Chloroflexi bacterium]|nr:hypothetical protein [Chloroflexota bacterium]